MSSGSVSPWNTSVPRITQNVRNTIRFRCASGCPPCVVNGKASAAASETAPRIPDHDTTSEWESGGVGSRSRMRRDTHRGRYELTGIHKMRVMTTVPVTSSASTTSVPFDVPGSAATMCGNWRPTSANSSALMTNVRISHTPAP